MKSNIKISPKSLQPLLKKTLKIVMKHAVFIAAIIILLAYVIVVWRINQLSNTEPSPDAVNAAQAKSTVPKIDKAAISQIQALEQTNTQVQALFSQARNNPFQE